MENDGAEDKEQGSGWCEVKKRHRPTLKSQVSCASRNSSGKIHYADHHCRESGNSQQGEQSKYQIQGPHVVASAGYTDVGHCSSLGKTVKSEDYPLKEVVSHVAKGPFNVMELIGGTAELLVVSRDDKVDNVPKIKWGDLDDFTVKLSQQSQCCNDVLLDHGNPKSASNVVSLAPVTLPLQDTTIEASYNEENFHDEMLSSIVKESFEEKWTKANDVALESVGLLGPDANITYAGNDAESFGEVHDKCNKPPEYEGRDNLATEIHISLPLRDDKIVTLHGHTDKLDDASMSIPETSIIHKNRGMPAPGEDSVLHVDSVSLPTDVLTVTNEDHKELHGCLKVIEDPSGAELGENKERFRQRLWCYLFENLNRAVDELYLLCELECDMEQIEEVILVLDEAGLDFRELKSRVEDFEGSKSLSSQLTKEGTTINIQADHHCRPHALSWEVRRMTTRSNRAEILSSSIEAFKKIRQERAKYVNQDLKVLGDAESCQHEFTGKHDDLLKTDKMDLKSSLTKSDMSPNVRDMSTKSMKHSGELSHGQGSTVSERLSTSIVNSSLVNPKDVIEASSRSCKELLEPISETEKQLSNKGKALDAIRVEKQSKTMDVPRKHKLLVEKEKERQNLAPWKSMDAWKEKRNWEDILRSPMRCSSRVSHSPGIGRKSVDRGRVLHDKLMSPEKKKKTMLDMKKEAEERHARAMRIRNQLESERAQRLQRTSEKLNRVNEWQAVRSLKLRERMQSRHQRSETRHEAYLAQVSKRAGDESSKVNEVRFITSLTEENKKLILRQKLHDSEVRRAEKLQVIRTKQKEDMAREEAVLERRKLLEAEKLQRIAEIQRKKEEAKVRREEERKASSAAREAKAVEQLRRKEERAKAQQEEAELLAQKLAEKLRESEQRRKFYLEQIREKASMDFRDQSSPLLRRSVNKEGPGRSTSTNSTEEYQTSNMTAIASGVGIVEITLQQSMKRRIKKIRQRLMALKHDFTENPVGAECSGIAYRSSIGVARAKIGRWLQELQRFRQARKEGAASIGLIVGDIMKYLEGKELELHASRQAGLIDFTASALPASHTSKPEACQVTRYLLRLLRVVLSVPANCSYFLSQNLLPPIIPMLSACLENHIKIAASSNPSGNVSFLSNKTTAESLEMVAEVLDGFLWTVTVILGFNHSDERQLQMQNGLIELVVAYQIIHRLRDLFALYDRPQIEGSPFPSSILLGLNFLAVLTCRSGTFSSVDWRTYLSKILSESNARQALLVKSSDNLCTLDAAALKCQKQDSNLSSVLAPLSFTAPMDRSSQTNPEESSPDPESQKNIPYKSICDASDRNQTSGISLEADGPPSSMNPVADLCKYPSFVLQKHSKTTVALQNEHKIKDGNGEGCNTCEPVIQVDKNRKDLLKQPLTFLLTAMSQTGLVSLPSLLTAVLLQANSKLSSEQASYVLPSNFEEVAIGVLKILNNVARLDINRLQNMLAQPDLQMEFFHLMSFLLSHCNHKWKGANDQVGLLLLESLLLLGYFSLFHTGNQAVLRWGKNPTILHKVCDLPFVFFSDPELTPILAGTLIAACYGCEQNRDVVCQELSVEMLLSLLKSCRQELLRSQTDYLTLAASILDCANHDNHNQTITEQKKSQGDFIMRTNGRNNQVACGRSVVLGSNLRNSRTRNQRDGKLRICEDWAFKHNLPAAGAASAFMLHNRLPTILIDKAEEFFSAAILGETA